jgi:sugar lactone lactonase YvrE
VHFPPRTASIENTSIQVRGRVLDATGLARVTINGTPVASTDNLATWSLEVPLNTGINELEVAQEDSNGVVTPVETLMIERTTPFISPRFVAQDTANNRLLVLDVSQDSLIAVDAITGARSQLSPPVDTAESKIRNAAGLMVDPARNRALIFQHPVTGEDDHIEFLAVDLSTGVQTEFAAPDFTNRYLYHEPGAMQLAGDKAFVADVEFIYLDASGNQVAQDDPARVRIERYGIIYSLDLLSGTRSVVSAYQVPDKANALARIPSLAHDPVQNTLYALDVRDNIINIMKVNTATGARTPLTVNDTTENPFQYSNPKDIALDQDSGRLLLLNGVILVAIDIATGTVTTVSSNLVPADADYKFGSVDNMVYDAATDTAFIIDDAQDLLMAVHGTNGTRSRVSSTGQDDPTGAMADRGITSLALSGSHQIYIADSPLNTIFNYQLQTGSKTVLSDPTIDEEDDDTVYVVLPKHIAWDSDAGRLLLLNGLNEIVALDPQTGKATPEFRFGATDISDMVFHNGTNTLYTSGISTIFKTVFSDPVQTTALSGFQLPDNQNYFVNLMAIDLDAPRNRLLAVDVSLNSLTAVDLTTGARTLISNSGVPDGGPGIQIPRALVVDGDRALVLDTGLKAILAVDLTTGVRSIFFNYSDVAGMRLYNPIRMELHPQFGYLLLADNVTDTVTALDLQTKQLVTVAR